jgi:hypothetical protein
MESCIEWWPWNCKFKLHLSINQWTNYIAIYALSRYRNISRYRNNAISQYRSIEMIYCDIAIYYIANAGNLCIWQQTIHYLAKLYRDILQYRIYCDIAIYSDRDILRQYRNIAISQYNILQKLMHLATDHHYLAKIFSLARHKPFYLVKFHQMYL